MILVHQHTWLPSWETSAFKLNCYLMEGVQICQLITLGVTAKMLITTTGMDQSENFKNRDEVIKF